MAAPGRPIAPEMSVYAFRLSHGRAGSRDPGGTQCKARRDATRANGWSSARTARLEHGKTAVDRRNAGPGAGTSNPRPQRNHAGTEGRSLATVSKNGRRPRQTSAPRGLRGPHRGFEDVQGRTQRKRCCLLCRDLRIIPMNTIAKAFILLIWFSASAVWAAEPTSVREFSERCAASYASAFEVPVELVDAVIQVESGWNPYAVSRKGAAGLLPLMPPTANPFRVPGPFQNEKNIRAGVDYPACLNPLF